MSGWIEASVPKLKYRTTTTNDDRIKKFVLHFAYKLKLLNKFYFLFFKGGLKVHHHVRQTNQTKEN